MAAPDDMEELMMELRDAGQEADGGRLGDEGACLEFMDSVLRAVGAGTSYPHLDPALLAEQVLARHTRSAAVCKKVCEVYVKGRASMADLTEVQRMTTLALVIQAMDAHADADLTVLAAGVLSTAVLRNDKLQQALTTDTEFLRVIDAALMMHAPARLSLLNVLAVLTERTTLSALLDTDTIQSITNPLFIDGAVASGSSSSRQALEALVVRILLQVSGVVHADYTVPDSVFDFLFAVIMARRDEMDARDDDDDSAPGESAELLDSLRTLLNILRHPEIAVPDVDARFKVLFDLAHGSGVQLVLALHCVVLLSDVYPQLHAMASIPRALHQLSTAVQQHAAATPSAGTLLNDTFTAAYLNLLLSLVRSKVAAKDIVQDTVLLRSLAVCIDFPDIAPDVAGGAEYKQCVQQGVQVFAIVQAMATQCADVRATLRALDWIPRTLALLKRVDYTACKVTAPAFAALRALSDGEPGAQTVLSDAEAADVETLLAGVLGAPTDTRDVKTAACELMDMLFFGCTHAHLLTELPIGLAIDPAFCTRIAAHVLHAISHNAPRSSLVQAGLALMSRLCLIPQVATTVAQSGLVDKLAALGRGGVLDVEPVEVTSGYVSVYSSLSRHEATVGAVAQALRTVLDVVVSKVDAPPGQPPTPITQGYFTVLYNVLVVHAASVSDTHAKDLFTGTTGGDEDESDVRPLHPVRVGVDLGHINPAHRGVDLAAVCVALCDIGRPTDNTGAILGACWARALGAPTAELPQLLIHTINALDAAPPVLIHGFVHAGGYAALLTALRINAEQVTRLEHVGDTAGHGGNVEYFSALRIDQLIHCAGLCYDIPCPVTSSDVAFTQDLKHLLFTELKIDELVFYTQPMYRPRTQAAWRAVSVLLSCPQVEFAGRFDHYIMSNGAGDGLRQVHTPSFDGLERVCAYVADWAGASGMGVADGADACPPHSILYVLGDLVAHTVKDAKDGVREGASAAPTTPREYVGAHHPQLITSIVQRWCRAREEQAVAVAAPSSGLKHLPGTSLLDLGVMYLVAAWVDSGCAVEDKHTILKKGVLPVLQRALEHTALPWSAAAVSRTRRVVCDLSSIQVDMDDEVLNSAACEGVVLSSMDYKSAHGPGGETQTAQAAREMTRQGHAELAALILADPREQFSVAEAGMLAKPNALRTLHALLCKGTGVPPPPMRRGDSLPPGDASDSPAGTDTEQGVQEPELQLSDARLYLCLPAAMQRAHQNETNPSIASFGSIMSAYSHRMHNTVDVAAPALILQSAFKYSRNLLAAYRRGVEAVGRAPDVALLDTLLDGAAAVLDGDGAKVLAADPLAAQHCASFVAEWFALVAPPHRRPGGRYESGLHVPSTPGTDALHRVGLTRALAACVKAISGAWTPGADENVDEDRCGALLGVSTWVHAVGGDVNWAPTLLHSGILPHLVLAGEKLGTLAADTAQSGNSVLANAGAVEETVFDSLLCCVAAHDEAARCLDDDGMEGLLRVAISHWNTRTSSVLHSCCGVLRYQARFFLSERGESSTTISDTLGKLLVAAFNLGGRLDGADKQLVGRVVVPPLLDTDCKMWLAHPLALLLRELDWEAGAQPAARVATPLTPGTSPVPVMPSVAAPQAMLDILAEFAGRLEFPPSRPGSAQESAVSGRTPTSPPPDLEPARAWLAALETLWSARARDHLHPVADDIRAFDTAAAAHAHSRAVFLPPQAPCADILVARVRALTERAFGLGQTRVLAKALATWRTLVRCGLALEGDATDDRMRQTYDANGQSVPQMLTRILRLHFGDAAITRAVLEILSRTVPGSFAPVTPSTPGDMYLTPTTPTLTPPTTAGTGGGAAAPVAPYTLPVVREVCTLVEALMDASVTLRPQSAGTVDSLEFESIASSRPGTAALDDGPGVDPMSAAWGARVVRCLLMHPALNSERRGKHPDQAAMRKAVLPCCTALLTVWMSLQRRIPAAPVSAHHCAVGEVCDTLMLAVSRTVGRWGAGPFGLSGTGVDRLCRIFSGAPTEQFVQAPQLLQRYLAVSASVVPHLDKLRRRAGESTPMLAPADPTQRPPSRPDSRAGSPAALARADIELLERIMRLRTDRRVFPACPSYILQHVKSVTVGASVKIGAMYAGSQATFSAMIKSLGDDPTSTASTHDPVVYATGAARFLSDFTEAHPTQRPVFAKQCTQGLAQRIRELVDGPSRRTTVFRELEELVPALELILRAEASTLATSLDEYCSAALADTISIVMFSSLFPSAQAKLDLLASLCHAIGALRPSDYSKEKIERALAAASGTDPFFSGCLFLPFTMWLEKGGPEAKEWVRARTETFWPSLTAFGDTLAWWWGLRKAAAGAPVAAAGDTAEAEDKSDNEEPGPVPPAAVASSTGEDSKEHVHYIAGSPNGEYLAAPLEFFTVLFRRNCVAKARLERVVDVVITSSDGPRPTSPGPTGDRNALFFLEYYLRLLDGEEGLPLTAQSPEAAVMGWFLSVLAHHVRDRQRRHSSVADLSQTPRQSHHSGTDIPDDVDDPVGSAVNDKILAVKGLGYVGIALQVYLDRAAATQDTDPATATASRARKADCLRGYKSLQVHNEVASSLDERSVDELRADLRAAVRAKTQSQGKIDDLAVQVEELQDELIEEKRACARAVDAVKAQIHDLEVKHDLDLVDQDTMWQKRLEDNENGWRAKLAGHSDIPELLDKLQSLEFSVSMAERTATQLSIQHAAEAKKASERHAHQLKQAEAIYKEKEESTLRLHAVETEHYRAEREQLVKKSARLDELEKEERVRSQYVGVEERAKTSALSQRMQQLVAENAQLFQRLHATQEAHAAKIKELQADFDAQLELAVAEERSRASEEEALLQAEVQGIAQDSSLKTEVFHLMRSEIDVRKALKAEWKGVHRLRVDEKDALVAAHAAARRAELQAQLVEAERIVGEANTQREAAARQRVARSLYRKHRELRELSAMEAQDCDAWPVFFAATGIPELVGKTEPRAREAILVDHRTEYRCLKRKCRLELFVQAGKTATEIDAISAARIDEYNAKWEQYVDDVEKAATAKVHEMQEVNRGMTQELASRDNKIAEMKARHTAMSTELARALNKSKGQRRASVVHQRELEERVKRAEAQVDVHEERRRSLSLPMKRFSLSAGADTEAVSPVSPESPALEEEDWTTTVERPSTADAIVDASCPWELEALMSLLEQAEGAVRTEIAAQHDASLDVLALWRTEGASALMRPSSANMGINCELLLEPVRPDLQSRQTSCNMLVLPETPRDDDVAAATPKTARSRQATANALVCDVLYSQLLQLPKEDTNDDEEMVGLRALEAASSAMVPGDADDEAEDIEDIELTEADYLKLTYDALLALPPDANGDAAGEGGEPTAAAPTSAPAAVVYNALFSLLIDEGEHADGAPSPPPVVEPQDDVPPPSQTVETTPSGTSLSESTGPGSLAISLRRADGVGRGNRHGLGGQVRAKPSISGEPHPPRPRRVTYADDDEASMLRDELSLLRHALSRLYQQTVNQADLGRCFTPDVLRRLSALLNRRVAGRDDRPARVRKSDATVGGESAAGWSRLSIWSECPGLQVLSLASRRTTLATSHRPSYSTTRSCSYVSSAAPLEDTLDAGDAASTPRQSPSQSASVSPTYARAERQVLEQLVEEHDTEMRRVKDELRAARDELEEWKATYRKYEDRIATNRELRELTETHRQAMSERNFLVSEVRSLKERLGKANTVELNLIARCEQLQNEVQQLRDVLKTTRDQADARQDAIVTLSKEIEELKFEGAHTPQSSLPSVSPAPAQVQALTKENEELTSQVAALQYQLQDAHAKARRVQITTEKLNASEDVLRREGLQAALTAWREAMDEGARLEEALLGERRQREVLQRQKEDAVKEAELAMHRRHQSSEKYLHMLQTRDGLQQKEKDLQLLSNELSSRKYDLEALDRHLHHREGVIRAASVQSRRLAPIEHPTTVPEDSAAWLAPVNRPVALASVRPPHHPHQRDVQVARLLNNTI